MKSGQMRNGDKWSKQKVVKMESILKWKVVKMKNGQRKSGDNKYKCKN